MKLTHVGLIEVIFCPFPLFTHSLLINKPVGWVYFFPLGAVNSIERSDMLRCTAALLNNLLLLLLLLLLAS